MKTGRKPFSMELLVQRGRIPSTWYEDVLNIGREGKAEVHIVNYLGVSWNTYQRLKERSPEFLKAVNQAQSLSEQWWIDVARQEWVKGNSRSINSNHWSLMVRNMFKERWSDKKEMDLTSKGDKINDSTISVEIIKKQDDKEENE